MLEVHPKLVKATVGDKSKVCVVISRFSEWSVTSNKFKEADAKSKNVCFSWVVSLPGVNLGGRVAFRSSFSVAEKFIVVFVTFYWSGVTKINDLNLKVVVQDGIVWFEITVSNSFYVVKVIDT